MNENKSKRKNISYERYWIIVLSGLVVTSIIMSLDLGIVKTIFAITVVIALEMLASPWMVKR